MKFLRWTMSQAGAFGSGGGGGGGITTINGDTGIQEHLLLQQYMQIMQPLLVAALFNLWR